MLNRPTGNISTSGFGKNGVRMVVDTIKERNIFPIEKGIVPLEKVQENKRGKSITAIGKIAGVKPKATVHININSYYH